jgi:voltage-gated sodium channel
LDFFIVLASLPLLLEPPWSEGSTLGVLAITPLLRLGRFLRFARVMRVIPNASHIWKGSARALRASVGVFLVLLTLNLVLALGANLLFGKILPEHFGDPLISSYTLFKVFTIEGWYEIPDHLARSGGDQSDVLFLRLYMIVSVLIGGILGLSLANAVFVDEMVNDNNEELENRVSELASEIRLLREELKAQAVGEASVENEGMPSD